MASNGKDVLISGASVAGLSTAYWLSRYGFNVTVVEIATTVRPGGQAIDVRGPAVEVAERMGILSDIHDRSTKLAGMSVVDSLGNELFRSDERSLTGGQFVSIDVELLRDELCDVLLKAVDDRVDYVYGDSITALNQDENGVDVAFASGKQRRFDLVIGADGLHSGVRRLTFGPEERFIRDLGLYVAVFGSPNFLDLDHWEIFHMVGPIMGAMLVVEKDSPAKTYIIFGADKKLEYDYRDIAGQKRLVTEQVGHMGWEFPRILDYMQNAADFHFDSTSQIRMDRWTQGRVALVGDAGYSVSPITGQGTTVAMVGAYVLAGELAAHPEDHAVAFESYETQLRDYMIRNQDAAADPNSGTLAVWSGKPGIELSDLDFGKLVQPFTLKDYQSTTAAHT